MLGWEVWLEWLWSLTQVYRDFQLMWVCVSTVQPPLRGRSQRDCLGRYRMYLHEFGE